MKAVVKKQVKLMVTEIHYAASIGVTIMAHNAVHSENLTDEEK